MGRRTSGQTVGLQTIGNVQASANTLTTTQANQNLLLDPNGTGTVEVVANINVTGDMTIVDRGDLRLREASANGTNYIAMQAAANMAADYTITWPAAASTTNGFVLTSQTDGTLAWSSAGGNIPVSDSGSTATVHYPFFGTNAGSLPSTLSPLARTNLAFVPSTGELSSDIGRHANIIGSTSNSGTVTIRGTSSATKATASVLMTDAVAASSKTTGTLVVTGGVGVSGDVWASNAVFEGTVNALRTENSKSADYTLALVDRDKVVSFTSASAQTVTVPPNSSVAFPTGSIVYMNRIGSGTLALAAGAGVTLSKVGSFASNEEIVIRKRDTNSWIVIDSPRLMTATGGSLLTTGGYNIHTFASSASLVAG